MSKEMQDERIKKKIFASQVRQRKAFLNQKDIGKVNT